MDRPPATPAPIQTPVCPRCGYDLSGITGSWTDSCPIHGICSECGLDFAWRDLLNPALAFPPWSFEHWRRLSPFKWCATNRRTWNPFRFFRIMRIEFPVAAGRLVLSIIAVLFLTHLTIAAATAWRVYRTASVSTTWTPPTFINGRVVPSRPTTTILPMRTVFQFYSGAIADAAIWPYRPYLLLRSASSVVGGAEPLAGLWALFIATFALTIPPAFLVLGESFRRCRVRFVHLLRGLAYSLPIPAACILAGLLVNALRPPDTGALILLLTVPWLCGYWFLFVIRYLRLEHARWVALCMLVIGGLCASIVTTCGWLLTMGRLW